jgi:hypothetical protein
MGVERISALEDKVNVIGKSGKHKDERIKKYKWNMQELWDSIK